MKKLTALDIMTREVVSVPDDLPVAELARLLSDKHISGAPVIDAKRRLVGVVSASDIVANELKVGQKVVSEADFYTRADVATRAEMSRMGRQVEDYADTLVRDIMTPVVISAPASATALELANLMGVNRIHRILIVESGTLVGVVSALDLLRGAPATVVPVRPREVVWATELAPGCEAVGRHAVALAQRIHARIVVFHVTPNLSDLWKSYGERAETGQLQTALEERALERLHDLVKDMRQQVVELEVVARTGDPAAAVLDFATERRPDYVVIGAKRPDKDRLKGLGSVAEKILSSLPTPVLAVPPEI